MLIKHKALLVAHGFTQISGINYHEARIYASVMRLETFRVISIAALFNHDLRPFYVSAAYLHREINGETYMGSPPGWSRGASYGS